jgi:hypothetical protein
MLLTYYIYYENKGAFSVGDADIYITINMLLGSVCSIITQGFYSARLPTHL